MRNNTLEVVMEAINEGDEAIVLSQLIHDPHAFFEYWGEIVEFNCYELLWWACEKGSLDVLKQLSRPIFNVQFNDSDSVAIEIASEHGHVQIVDYLLQNPRVDPCANHNGAVRRASARGRVDVVQRLLHDPRVEPSASDNYAIRFASQNGHAQIVSMLLKDDRVTISSIVAIHSLRKAALYGRKDVLDVLLSDTRFDPTDVRFWEFNSNQREVLLRLLQDPRVRRRSLLKIAYTIEDDVLSYLAAYKDCRKDRWLLQLMPHIRVKDMLVKSFEERFTDAPPHINKWVWEGGPGYHESLEACFQ